MRCGVPNQETDVADVVRLTPNKYILQILNGTKCSLSSICKEAYSVTNSPKRKRCNGW